MTSRHQDTDLVVAYLAHAKTVMRDGTDAEFCDARKELDSLVTDEPERAWPVICKVIQQISDDDILAYVAAGPLEDILVHHPHAFIDRVEALARQDAHFRRTVSGVWAWNSLPPEIRRRLDALLGDEPRL
jgi:Family of unknown function (DUF6869)